MQRTLSVAGERINAPSVNPVFGHSDVLSLSQRMPDDVRCPLLYVRCLTLRHQQRVLVDVSNDRGGAILIFEHDWQTVAAVAPRSVSCRDRKRRDVIDRFPSVIFCLSSSHETAATPCASARIAEQCAQRAGVGDRQRTGRAGAHERVRSVVGRRLAVEDRRCGPWSRDTQGRGVGSASGIQ
jgi:hypothetical protein